MYKFFQDMQSVDLEPFVYGGTNITGFRMIDPEDPMVRDAIEYFKNREISRFGDLSVINFNKTFLKVKH